MRLNADFGKRVVIRPEDYTWVSSPESGVDRMMLDRIGDEVARATSLVRFGPDATFPEHVHGGGEEFFVLEGAFGDEHEIYPAGTYVRNPIGTSHSPRVGPEGCLIFVKLYQFDDADDKQFAVDTRKAAWESTSTPGIEVLRLHEYGTERAALIRWAKETPYPQHEHDGGEEIFVLEGSWFDEDGDYPAGTWVRSPHLSTHTPFTRDEGTLLFVKTGHLPGQ